MTTSNLFLLFSVIFSIIVVISGQSCSPITTCPTTLVQVPTAWFNLTFSTNISTPTIPWLATDPADSSCSGFLHTGLINLTGGTTSASSGTQYVDLLATSGTNYVGATLPGLIGGPSSTNISSGQAGWSFEVTFKATTNGNYAKLICIGNGPALADIVLGWSGGSSELDYQIFDPTSQTGNNALQVMIANANFVMGQWYHIIVVHQQVSSILTSVPSNTWFYVNGVLLNNNVGVGVIGSPWYYPTNVTRQYSYLGRSNWNGDNLWVGKIDTFRIYNVSLTSAQVTALYNSEIGGCAITVTSTPIVADPFPNNRPPAATAAPTPYYGLNFASDPRLSLTPNIGVGNYSYNWENLDPADTFCGLNSNIHKGLIILSGGFNIGTTFADLSYVNMTSTTYPNGVSSTPMPILGGNQASSGNVLAGSTGWSFEITFKAGVQETWGELINIGTIRNASTGTPSGDIILSWLAATQNMQVALVDANGVASSQQIALLNILPGSWYHVVFVIQALENGNGNWQIYRNGQLTGTITNTLFIPALIRQNADLGKSGYAADNFWAGEVDSFNIYNVALSDGQVTTLFTASMGASGTPNCGTSIQVTPVIPATAVFFSATFDTNPAQVANPGYSWMATDVNDTLSGLELGTNLAHIGILVLNGTDAASSAGDYVNLSTSTGPFSIGQVLQPFGGEGTGDAASGTLGWSFEFTWKAYVAETNAKVRQTT